MFVDVTLNTERVHHPTGPGAEGAVQRCSNGAQPELPAHGVDSAADVDDGDPGSGGDDQTAEHALLPAGDRQGLRDRGAGPRRPTQPGAQSRSHRRQQRDALRPPAQDDRQTAPGRRPRRRRCPPAARPHRS